MTDKNPNAPPGLSVASRDSGSHVTEPGKQLPAPRVLDRLHLLPQMLDPAVFIRQIGLQLADPLVPGVDQSP